MVDENQRDTKHSLLERARQGDAAAWRLMVDIYEPMMSDWLHRFGVPSQEVEDLKQEVLALLFKGLGSFEHQGRTGSFRAWLRTLTINRARTFWRLGKGRPQHWVAIDLHSMVGQLEDPHSDLSRLWDQQHDEYVIRRSLATLAEEFDEQTLLVFKALVLEGRSVRETAQEFGMSVVAVYGAKARVLSRLREMTAFMLDWPAE